MAQDGAALLHRVSRINDPEATEQVGVWWWAAVGWIAGLRCFGRPATCLESEAGRGAQHQPSLDDEDAGVATALIPTPYPPTPNLQGVRDICSSIDDKDAGADCAVALTQAASQRQAGVGARPRFQVSE